MKLRRVLCLTTAMLLFVSLLPQSSVRAESVSCKSLCSAAIKAAGGGNQLKYKSTSAMDFGALSASARKKVKNMQYVCDEKEVYSLCVIEAKSVSHASALCKVLQDYKKRNCSSNYLSDYSPTERKVFQNAVYGKKGKYVWYVALSPSASQNKKGQAAIKNKL